jgi:hypothetical protein
MFIVTWGGGQGITQLVETMRYKPEGRGFSSQYRWKFFLPHYAASNRDEYQEYFLGCKGGRCVRVRTLPHSRAIVTKSGSLTTYSATLHW